MSRPSTTAATAATVPSSSASAAVSSLPLPLIDLRDTVGLAARIDRTCREQGFMYIVGHGIDKKIREDAFDAARRLFSLSEEVKARWHINNSPIARGFTPMGAQRLDLTKAIVDMKESFYLGVDRDASDPLVIAKTPNHGPNQYPDESLIPGFKAACTAYTNALEKLAKKLMSLMAEGLGLPSEYFEQFIRNPTPVLRMLHYPPCLEVGQVGCGAHTDWGGLTLLAQDDIGGLQVRAPDGSWFDAPPVEDSFVINLGDMTQRWTNDAYVSTMHRVLNPPSSDRYSVVYFFDIDYHAIVTALPGCYSESNPARYPPISAGEHIKLMYERTWASVKQ